MESYLIFCLLFKKPDLHTYLSCIKLCNCIPRSLRPWLSAPKRWTTLTEWTFGHNLNALRPRQNGRHFADDIFKSIFLSDNVSIPIKISLKFVPNGPIHNIPAMFQIMAWRRPGDKPLSESVMVSLPTHICVTRSLWVYALDHIFGVVCCARGRYQGQGQVIASHTWDVITYTCPYPWYLILTQHSTFICTEINRYFSRINFQWNVYINKLPTIFVHFPPFSRLSLLMLFLLIHWIYDRTIVLCDGNNLEMWVHTG